MTVAGSFTFVLHSHLPYCRRSGTWPAGEEWLFEGLLDTYVPLIGMLSDLADRGVRYRIVIGVTPVLAEQLGAEDMLAGFEFYAEDRIARAERDRSRFEGTDPGRAELAGWYAGHFRRILARFRGPLGRDPLGALRRLRNGGWVEILTGAATHGYLPLLGRESSIAAQVRVGRAVSERWFGTIAGGIWLPECAYRPARVVSVSRSESWVRPGVDDTLAESRLTHFLCESHAVEGGRAFWEAEPPGAKIRRGGHHGRAADPAGPVAPDRTTFLPYQLRSGCHVFARNRRTGPQVRSGDWVYPGDGWYREFHKKDSESGLQYWRITGRRVDLGEKALYEPDKTGARVGEHAEHFARLVEEMLVEFRRSSGGDGMVVAPYDTELFGHWWFEGVDWLGGVLERLAANPKVRLETLAERLASRPPTRGIDLPESSWGEGGDHRVWQNHGVGWIWPLIHAAELRMERLVRDHPLATGVLRRVLDQAARELLLAQSSDWPFLMTTGQAGDYATERFRAHLERFDWLASVAESARRRGQTAESDPARTADGRLAEIEAQDALFPDMDYRVFRAREPDPFEDRRGDPLTRVPQPRIQ